MAKRMTEAAQLYWKDIDVLEEARNELVDYLDEVWRQTWEKILSLWEEGAETTDLKKPNHWADRQKRGQWTVFTPHEQPANIEIQIRDPRRSHDPKSYTVSLVCYQSNQKKLEKVSENAKGAVNAIANSHGIEIDWDTPDNWLLERRSIEVIPLDADLMSTEVAKVTYTHLSAIAEINKWMLEATGKQIPTG